MCKSSHGGFKELVSLLHTVIYKHGQNHTVADIEADVWCPSTPQSDSARKHGLMSDVKVNKLFASGSFTTLTFSTL